MPTAQRNTIQNTSIMQGQGVATDSSKFQLKLKCSSDQPPSNSSSMSNSTDPLLPRSYQSIAPQPQPHPYPCHTPNGTGAMWSNQPHPPPQPYFMMTSNYYHPNPNAFMTFYPHPHRSPTQEFLHCGNGSLASSGNSNIHNCNDTPFQSNAQYSGNQQSNLNVVQQSVSQPQTQVQVQGPFSQARVEATNSNNPMNDVNENRNDNENGNALSDLPKTVSMPNMAPTSPTMPTMPMEIMTPSVSVSPSASASSSPSKPVVKAIQHHTAMNENHKSAFSPLRRTEVQSNSKSRSKSKSFPRIKHMLTRIKTDENEAKSRSRQLQVQVQQFESIEIQKDVKICFDKISSYYPPVSLNGSKRSLSSISSSSSSSSSSGTSTSPTHSSSPETVPSITEECLEKDNHHKRSKTTASSSNDDENETPLDILCEAVSIAISKQKKDAIKVMETLDKTKSCSCPRSRCIKLYCECFQDGRMCSDKCACKKCKNTKAESGPHGLRTRAMQNILMRNPYAFQKDKKQLPVPPPSHEGIVCKCVKSRCLKLYCDCFQSGQVCGPFCLCVSCLNTESESGVNGKRTLARKLCLQRKPDAFVKKKKEVGSCSCRNSRCLKKYCECFNNGLACTEKCSCKDCANLNPSALIKTKRKLSTKIKR